MEPSPPLNPSPPTAEPLAPAIALALQHHRNGRFLEAERLYRQVLAADPEHFDALHLLGVLAYQAGNTDVAIDLIGNALTMNDRHPAAFNNLGDAFFASGRPEKAEDAYRRAVALDPEFALAHGNLGNALYSLGRLREAEGAYRRAITLKPDYARAHCNLGNALRDLGRPEEAEDAYRQAIAFAPDFAAAHCNLGNALHDLGRLKEAEDAYRRAIAIDPRHADAHGNLGDTLRELGHPSEAEVAYRRAIAIKPDSAEAYVNLGNLLREFGRMEEAESAYRQAIGIRPGFAEAFSNLGNALKDLGLPEEAEDAYRRAIALKPEYAEAHVNLGNMLHDLGSADEAEGAYRRAIALKPDYAEAHLHLLMVPLPISAGSSDQAAEAAGRFSDFLGVFRKTVEGKPAHFGNAVGAAQPFHLAYRMGDHTQLLARYGDAICGIRQAWFRERSGEVARAARPACRKRRRLVIVSGHLRRHPVWDVLLHGLLLHLDRRRFEVILYHTSPAQTAEAGRARELVDRFVQGPGDWLQRTCDDRPDILLYPEIGMEPETLKLATLRLAPLQAAYWGHPITTGLPTIDLFLSGELLEPPDADRHYREKLVRLPGTGACSVWSPFEAKKPILDLPGNRDVARFLVCQQATKYDPFFDAIYPRIARATGPCRFWFVRDRKFPWASDIVGRRIRAAFAAAGLDPAEYVQFIDWLPGGEFAGLLDEMDIFLDTPAFSGYTTAWQAVHRGIPVVSLEGGFLRQRLSAGLLRRIGVTETIAGNDKEYVDRAAALARSLEKRTELRKSLQASAVRADKDVRVIRALETALENAWVEASRSPPL